MPTSLLRRLLSGPSWPRILLLWAVGTFVLLLRLNPGTRATLWAEDGTLFFNDAVDSRSTLDAFEPYAGYLHVVPRLLAQLLVGLLPLEYFALGVTVVSCAVAAGIAALVFVLGRTLLPQRTPRALLWVITLLVPVAPVEALGNLANLHWYFLWLAFWLVLYRPKTWFGSAFLGFAAVCAGLTEIQVLAVVPLFLLWWRDHKRWPVYAGLLIGIAAQVATTLSYPREPAVTSAPSPLAIVEGYLVHGPLAAFWPGSAVIRPLIVHFGWWVLLLVLVPFVLLIVYVLRKGTVVQRIVALAMPALGALCYAAATIVTPNPDFKFDEFSQEQIFAITIGRYGFIPSLTLLALVPLALSVMLAQNSRFVRPLPLVTVILLGVVLAQALLPFAMRASSPQWLQQFAPAREQCVVQEDEGRETIQLSPPGWQVSVDCDLLIAS